jgi:hypothetical protein
MSEHSLISRLQKYNKDADSKYRCCVCIAGSKQTTTNHKCKKCGCFVIELPEEMPRVSVSDDPEGVGVNVVSYELPSWMMSGSNDGYVCIGPEEKKNKHCTCVQSSIVNGACELCGKSIKTSKGKSL